jgi:3-oxoacyl-[acyl-carrier-protein] synthase-1
MLRPVFITGLGLITAVGDHVQDHLNSLKSGRLGVGSLNLLHSVYGHQKSFAEVPHANEELAQMAQMPFSDQISRTALLGAIAAAEALRDAEIDFKTDDSKFKTGLVSATSVGGMRIIESCFKEILDAIDSSDKLELIYSLDSSDSTERIAKHIGINGFITTISTACSSSANAIMYGARLIQAGILDRVLVGGTDSLSLFTINGFNSLKILDSEPAKPFDQNRRGLNLGEAAGYLLLESEKAAHGKRVYGLLTGFANTNDAFHQTASSPDGQGAYMAMKTSLEMAGVAVDHIGYINAHGTGTEQNDLSEGLAIEKLFKNNVPMVSSTKPITGHTLAAAGAVEAVFSVLSLYHGMVFPNHHFKNPMPEISFTPNLEFKEGVDLKHVLSNSFGFGGNSSSLLFSRAD